MNCENVQPKRETRKRRRKSGEQNNRPNRYDTVRHDTKYQPKKEMEFAAGKWTETKTQIKMKKKKPRRIKENEREKYRRAEDWRRRSKFTLGPHWGRKCSRLAFVLALYIYTLLLCECVSIDEYKCEQESRKHVFNNISTIWHILPWVISHLPHTQARAHTSRIILLFYYCITNIIIVIAA